MDDVKAIVQRCLRCGRHDGEEGMTSAKFQKSMSLTDFSKLDMKGR